MNLAASLAGLISFPLGIPRAYWVMLAAVAVLQATSGVRYTVTRAVQRIGTLLGVGVFWLVISL